MFTWNATQHHGGLSKSVLSFRVEDDNRSIEICQILYGDNCNYIKTICTELYMLTITQTATVRILLGKFNVAGISVRWKLRIEEITTFLQSLVASLHRLKNLKENRRHKSLLELPLAVMIN
jgi:hypothetical protein